MKIDPRVQPSAKQLPRFCKSGVLLISLRVWKECQVVKKHQCHERRGLGTQRQALLRILLYFQQKSNQSTRHSDVHCHMYQYINEGARMNRQCFYMF